MAVDSVVEIFIPVDTKTSDGIVKKTFDYTSPDATIMADVQPKNLSPVEMASWGIKNLQSDAKAVYSFGDDTYLVFGNRARVDGKYIYDIRARNEWNVHREIILLPIQGVSYAS